MAKHTTSRPVYTRARQEAEFRLRELALEAKLLIDLFPDLRDVVSKDDLPLRFLMATESGALAKKTAKGRKKR